jgi:thiol-disulfide isomerase/thioredoxin
MSQPSIITQIDTLKEFQELATVQNPGAFVVKFGAEWCGPCKKIEVLVNQCMAKMPNHVQCAILDVDESFEVYAFFKSKRIFNAIPAIVVYYRENTHYVPDHVVVSSDPNQVVQFFSQVVQHVSRSGFNV